ncbi:MAG TPA: zf-CGNR multi-domain protein [Planctomycetes bacterium]|nr:zf-CGNR multi-domain protein [Planctomycetota bacterium]
MPWPPRFLFLSNRLSIDFTLTGGEGERAHLERWNSPRDLQDWYEASSLALSLRSLGPDDLVAAKELREVLWAGAQATISGSRPGRAVWRALERAAAHPDLVPVHRRGKLGWSPDSTPAQALSSVARDGLVLFGSDLRHRLRECKNPHCRLLFVDTSRPGRRAWCAMRRCGNLEKTSRYRRKRAAKAKQGPTP